MYLYVFYFIFFFFWNSYPCGMLVCIRYLMVKILVSHFSTLVCVQLSLHIDRDSYRLLRQPFIFLNINLYIFCHVHIIDFWMSLYWYFIFAYFLDLHLLHTNNKAQAYFILGYSRSHMQWVTPHAFLSYILCKFVLCSFFFFF